MIAVCDVDDVHTAEFNKDFEGKLERRTRDYRVLLEKEKPDVVTIGTPDHWHVPIAIAALRAGCDVYCEKPLTLTIEEGIDIRHVVEETGRVFQVGTQQRSENDNSVPQGDRHRAERPAGQERQRLRRHRRRAERRTVRIARPFPKDSIGISGSARAGGGLLRTAPQACSAGGSSIPAAR